VRGTFKNSDGTFTAVTFTKSKTFKTEKGAEKWLLSNGIDKNGNNVSLPPATQKKGYFDIPGCLIECDGIDAETRKKYGGLKLGSREY
jgi:hypothetical protein